jgi:hypothetical protein
MAGDTFEMELLSLDFGQVAINPDSSVSGRESSFTFASALGPVGGPYTTIAELPNLGGQEAHFVGANNGAGDVAPFSNVVLYSYSAGFVLPPGPEREAAEKETLPGRQDLYEWSGGGSCQAAGSSCRLVNVDDQGKLLNRCGAVLGAIPGYEPEDTLNAVSADGSRVFFASPQGSGEPGCLEPALYMRVNGRETIDVSEPEEVSIAPSERGAVFYDGANSDGSEVFFTSVGGLTPGASAQSGPYLYEYQTEAPAGHRLTLIASEVERNTPPSLNFVLSGNGSVVYYRGIGEVQVQGKPVGIGGIWRYDIPTKARSFVAQIQETFRQGGEPLYTTPDGAFLAFASGNTNSSSVEFLGPHGLERELRGAGHEEFYRYDAADGSVMCVSCGEGFAPQQGKVLGADIFGGPASLKRPDSHSVVWMSDDGRRAFFQTSAKLVPQDTNENPPNEYGLRTFFGLGEAADVYEWEAPGTEEAPGVFCEVANGCTRLISAGEAVGPELFLGASADGKNVLFTSAAQLVPQATPEFTNIYDARVDGGFPAPAHQVECTSCQGVGSPPLLFSPGASLTFSGVGNPVSTTSAKVKTAPKPKRKRKQPRARKRKQRRSRTARRVRTRKKGARS